MIGDGHMHGIGTALTHLPEDLFRPVAILKSVDHKHAVTSGCWACRNIGSFHAGEEFNGMLALLARAV